MRMSEISAMLDATEMDILSVENAHLADQLSSARRALNDIIMLEVVHSGLSSARIIQEACDIARREIYGKTRAQSIRDAAHENS